MEMEGIIPLSLAPVDSFTPGKEVLFAGFPNNFLYTYKARLTEIMPWGNSNAWVIDKRAAYGLSGSPVIDIEGKLIGLLFASTENFEESVLVPVDNLRSLIEN